MDNYKKEYSTFSSNPKTKPLKYNFESDVKYVVDVDMEFKEVLKVKIEDTNEVVKIYTPQKTNNNFREALPQVATILEVHGEDAQFKVGDTILTYHFAFVDQDRVAKPFKKLGDKEVYLVDELEVLSKINTEESDSGKIFEPRKQVVVCKPIYDKLLNTTLEVSSDFEDLRRDLVKVIKSWVGCEEDIDDESDYLILDDGGDYLFKYKGVQYVFVDFYWDSAIAIVNNGNWRDKEIKKHMKDHNNMGYDEPSN